MELWGFKFNVVKIFTMYSMSLARHINTSNDEIPELFDIFMTFIECKYLLFKCSNPCRFEQRS